MKGGSEGVNPVDPSEESALPAKNKEYWVGGVELASYYNSRDRSNPSGVDDREGRYKSWGEMDEAERDAAKNLGFEETDFSVPPDGAIALQGSSRSARRRYDGTNWEQYVEEESGDLYYYNTETRETQWNMPDEVVASRNLDKLHAMIGDKGHWPQWRIDLNWLLLIVDIGELRNLEEFQESQLDSSWMPDDSVEGGSWQGMATAKFAQIKGDIDILVGRETFTEEEIKNMIQLVQNNTQFIERARVSLEMIRKATDTINSIIKSVKDAQASDQEDEARLLAQFIMEYYEDFVKIVREFLNLKRDIKDHDRGKVEHTDIEEKRKRKEELYSEYEIIRDIIKRRIAEQFTTTADFDTYYYALKIIKDAIQTEEP